MDKYLKCLTIFSLIFLLSAGTITAQTKLRKFQATAYCGVGIKCPYSNKTASGIKVRKGIAAADPKVLPLGTIINVVEPKEYAGRYYIADTGGAIKNFILDLWLPTFPDARKFGRRNILIEVIGFIDPKLILKNKISISSILQSCHDFISDEYIAESRKE